MSPSAAARGRPAGRSQPFLAPPSLGGPAAGLRLTSTQDALDLIDDLKLALRRSRAKGSSEIVFRIDARRRPLLLVEIHCPFGERGRL